MGLRLVFLAIGIAFALVCGSSAGSQGATPLCTVAVHDAALGKSEFDLSCKKDITGGSFAFVFNRGGCENGCGPSEIVPAGAGHLDCLLRGEAPKPGAQPRGTLGCRGSLTAGATAKVFQVLRTFTRACDLPVFKGTYTVAFGDGTHLGPRPLPPYRCIARRHTRAFDNTHVGGSEPNGRHGFVIGLRAVDGYTRCVVRAPVWVQARHGSGWATIARARLGASPNPKNVTVVFGDLPSGYGSGTYRVVAPRLRFGNQVCPQLTVIATG
jgi:hypothetical protein